MEKEIKKYTTVTFLCRGDRSHGIKEKNEGIRLIDWMRTHAPIPTSQLMGILDQTLVLLRGRLESESRDVCGVVCPHLFVIDALDRVRLLDLTDRSNAALYRKIQTGSVMRYFYPPGMGSPDSEQTELYGFGRLCQYMLAVNEESGEAVTGTLRYRLERFIGNCLSEGTRPITQYEKAADTFGEIRELADKREEEPTHGKSRRARKILYTAAALLAAVLLMRKTGAGPGIFQKDQDRIYKQVAQIEQQIDRLEQEQKELRELME